MHQPKIHFASDTDLESIIKQHPSYVKIFSNEEERDGKIVIFLSKHSGQSLYCVSDVDLEKLSYYLVKTKKTEQVEKRASESVKDNVAETNKKSKQQNIMSFFKKV